MPNQSPVSLHNLGILCEASLWHSDLAVQFVFAFSVLETSNLVIMLVSCPIAHHLLLAPPLQFAEYSLERGSGGEVLRDKYQTSIIANLQLAAAISAGRSLTSAMQLHKLHGGGYTGAFRRTCVISAQLRELPAATKCQFSGYTGASRPPFRRILCNFRIFRIIHNQ